MNFGKTKTEFKVGIFVFIAIIILFIFVLLIGDFKNTISAYKVTFIFNFINGVKVGAPVRFAGVDVGQVRHINIVASQETNNTKVEIVAYIRKGVHIPEDSEVWVNTLGLLGEKYIEIMPGKNYANFLGENAMIIGNNPLPMHEFGELAKSIATKLDQSMNDIKTLTNSISSFTQNLDDGLTKIKNKEGTLGKLLYDDSLYKQLEELVVDIRKHPWKLLVKPREKSAEPKSPKK
ncbi:MAG: MlaD family protein [Candidatus Omnitrophica bacterium]|nr:MlaD family protein [Candidatus Omnitrophota bacterium]